MVAKGAETLVSVGALKGPHGLKGLVKAIVALDDIDLLVKAGPVYTAAGAALVVTKWQPAGQGCVALTIDGVTTVDGAEALKGQKLFLDRANWPEEAGAVYVDTLVGRAVVDEAGAPVGVVKAVVNLPAGPALDVARDSDGKTALVPLGDDFVVVDTPLRLTALGGDVVQL